MKSDEVKENMKESPRRYTNPFLSDEENDKVNFWNNPELKHEVDFTTNLEDEKFQKSSEGANVLSESLEKAKELYVDKKVTECACFEDSSFHLVKDICVDEGLSHEEKIEIDKEHHHKLSCNPISLNGDKHDEMIKDDLGSQFSEHEELKSPSVKDSYTNDSLLSVTKENHGNDHMNNGYNHDHDDMVGGNLDTQFHEGKDHNTNSDSSFETKEKADTDLVITEPTNDQNSSQGKDCERKLDSSSEYSPNNSSDNGVNDVDQQLTKAESFVEDKTNDIKMVENTTLNSDDVKSSTINNPHETENRECVQEQLSLETQNEANHQEVAANELQRGGAESSFSTVSGLISYSGPVVASGSISHRSDSSNTSVRSFAFPILQTEWNSSPVRMAKVDQRRSRKHRGWRQALICCRF